jgi:hypothetical protein
MDYIEPIPFLVIMALIVAAWLVLTTRDRRRWQAEAAAWHRAVDRVQYVTRTRGCAVVWWDEPSRGYGVCERRLDHDGPHVDTLTGHILR